MASARLVSRQPSLLIKLDSLTSRPLCHFGGPSSSERRTPRTREPGSFILRRGLSTIPPDAAQTAAESMRRRLNLPPAPPPTGNALVDRLNQALHTYPLTTSMVYLYHNPVYAGVVFGGLTIAGVSPPLDLGVAFAISGALRRFRIPVIFGLSAGVVKVFPSLAQLRVSALLSAPFVTLMPESKPADAPIDNSTGNVAGNGGSIKPASGLAHWAERGKGLLSDLFNPVGGRLTTLADRYGLAYVLTARAVSTANLLAIAYALYHGIDIGPLLEWIGSTGKAATGYLSRWAASCLVVNFAYPAVLHWGVSGLSLSMGQRAEPKLVEMAGESAEALKEMSFALGKARERAQDAKRGTTSI